MDSYTFNRWIAADRNDFAARMQWTLSPKYESGNHAPSVKIVNGRSVDARAGSTVRLYALISDPDGDRIAASWWQYPEEGTYEGEVSIIVTKHNSANVKVPADAKPGQVISIIAQVTDEGGFPLTRYDRVFIGVI